jgi:hypothetical protein
VTRPESLERTPPTIVIEGVLELVDAPAGRLRTLRLLGRCPVQSDLGQP